MAIPPLASKAIYNDSVSGQLVSKMVPPMVFGSRTAAGVRPVLLLRMHYHGMGKRRCPTITSFAFPAKRNAAGASKITRERRLQCIAVLRHGYRLKIMAEHREDH